MHAQLNKILKTELICEIYFKKYNLAYILDNLFLSPSNYYSPKEYPGS